MHAKGGSDGLATRLQVRRRDGGIVRIRAHQAGRILRSRCLTIRLRLPVGIKFNHRVGECDKHIGDVLLERILESDDALRRNFSRYGRTLLRLVHDELRPDVFEPHLHHRELRLCCIELFSLRGNGQILGLILDLSPPVTSPCSTRRRRTRRRPFTRARKNLRRGRARAAARLHIADRLTNKGSSANTGSSSGTSRSRRSHTFGE